MVIPLFCPVFVLGISAGLPLRIGLVIEVALVYLTNRGIVGEPRLHRGERNVGDNGHLLRFINQLGSAIDALTLMGSELSRIKVREVDGGAPITLVYFVQYVL